MTINYQFGDVDAHGATIRAHGAKVQTAGANMASTDTAVGSSWA